MFNPFPYFLVSLTGLSHAAAPALKETEGDNPPELQSATEQDSCPAKLVATAQHVGAYSSSYTRLIRLCWRCRGSSPKQQMTEGI